MIPDFPEANAQIMKMLNRHLKDQVRLKAPVFHMANITKAHEGDCLGNIDENEKHTVNKMERVESKFFIPNEEVETITTSDILKKLTEAAGSMASQMEIGIFKQMTKAVAETGNNLDNKPLTPDTLLDAMEKIPMSFEDDDISKPINNVLLVSEEGMKKLNEAESQSSPEEIAQRKEREQQIIKKKHQEHMDDLNSRKIVD